MAKKTLVEQIKDTQIELEKVRAEKKQKENQLAKLQKQEREKEHRVRTRRLIQKGAVLESVDPNLAQLNEEQLKACLREIFSNHTVQEVAKNHLLSQQEVDTP